MRTSLNVSLNSQFQSVLRLRCVCEGVYVVRLCICACAREFELSHTCKLRCVQPSVCVAAAEQV